ncbi:MAG TPA: pyrroloquinoline-quinone synthase PqqC [Polyangiaceae bacterium]|nr:pyrroloquinoline-quinone synthase PqqC [Polyangiaceae bacterium]
MSDALLGPDTFVERLRAEGASRYHDKHPFNVRMHAGSLSKEELQRWVINRYYYQTRIPVKDALLLSKSDDPVFRRAWIRRIGDHDGTKEGEGGLAEWLLLSRALGLDESVVRSCARVLPGVRYACDSYVALVRDRTLLEAVASSLTEHFAPDIMRTRVAAWEKHYPWIDAAALAYFRSRVPRATRDAQEALAFVVEQAKTREQQEACVRALVDKCRILWAMLDTIAEAAP